MYQEDSAPILHLRLASWVESQTGGQLTGQDEMVGYHLEQAYLSEQSLAGSTPTPAPLH